MPKSLEDAKKALEAVENGSELVTAVLTAIDAEKQRADDEKKRGIAEVNKKNKEAEGLRKFKKSMESIGYSAEEDDLESFTADVVEKMAVPKKGKRKNGDGNDDDLIDVTDSPEFKELSKNMKSLEKKFNQSQDDLIGERKNATDMKIKNQNSHMKTGLVDALRDRVYGADLLANDLIRSGKVKVDEDDERTIIFVGKDDEDIDFDDGIKNILETRKDIVRNQQSGGGGGAGGDKGKGKDKSKETNDEAIARVRKLGSATVY